MRSRARALILAVLLCAPVAAFGQAGAPARRITAGADLPPTCISSVVIRDIFYKSGSNAGLYVCTAADTWTLQSGLADVVGPASSTADAIALFSDTTGKLLKNSAVTIDATGNITMPQDKTINSPGSGSGDLLFFGFGSNGPRFKNLDAGNAWATISVASVTADHTYVLPNADGTFTLGGNTFSGTGSVMRATMPILDDTLFAALGAPANGAITYCSDCTKATPCADSGTGAIAKRLNGAWDCD